MQVLRQKESLECILVDGSSKSLQVFHLELGHSHDLGENVSQGRNQRIEAFSSHL